MTAPWWQRRLCAFDTETTGADPLEARLVTAAVLLVGNGEPTETRGWVFQPEIDIPEAAAAIHGYTTERARAEGRPAKEALAEVRDALVSAWAAGAALVAFNAVYDLTVITRELARHELPPIELGPVVDPLVLDRRVDRYRRGSRKLVDCCTHYSVPLDQAHDAGADAIAAARLAYRLGQRFAEVGGLELPALHKAQADWFAEDAANLEQYFAKKGTPRACSREWPMRTPT